MKKLINIILGGVFILFFFYSCTKEELVNYDGRVYGTVSDYVTHAPISSATVIYYVNGQKDSVMTDTNGYYLITGLNAGYYRFSISKPGYATILISQSINNFANVPTSPNGGSVTEYYKNNISMYSLNATVKGRIMMYLGPNSELRPAADFPYVLKFDNGYMTPRIFPGTTDANGEFTITGVPAYSYAYLNVGPKTVGTGYYYSSYYINGIVPNDTSYLNGRLYQNSGPVVALISTNLDSTDEAYTASFPVGNNIILNFNKPMSLDLTKAYGGSISLSGYTFNLDTQVSFSSNTVTIDPPIDLNHDTNYTLTFDLYSTTPRDEVSGQITFHSAK